MRCLSFQDPWFYRYKATELVFTPADSSHTFYMSGEVTGEAGEAAWCSPCFIFSLRPLQPLKTIVFL
jgi:hypothetical protein